MTSRPTNCSSIPLGERSHDTLPLRAALRSGDKCGSGFRDVNNYNFPSAGTLHSRIPMPTRRWRRRHGPDVIAEVVANGQGAWRAKVCLSTNPTVSVSGVRGVDSLSTAQAKADAFARKTFDHRCDARCGEWAWESEDGS